MSGFIVTKKGDIKSDAKWVVVPDGGFGVRNWEGWFEKKAEAIEHATRLNDGEAPEVFRCDPSACGKWIPE